MDSRWARLLDILTEAELLTLMEDVAARLRTRLASPAETVKPARDSPNPRRRPPRKSLRLKQLVASGLVRPQVDTLLLRGHPNSDALLIDARFVAWAGQRMTINAWAKEITGWKGVNIYDQVVVQGSGRSLDELRQELERAGT